MELMEKMSQVDVYFNMGYSLIPVRERSKMPLLKEWQKTKITTMEDMAEYFLDNENINIGMLTGKANGIIVIDIDVKKEGDTKTDGMASILKKQEELGVLPHTVVMRSQSGGLQYWYKYPQHLDYVKGRVGILENVDIRADGNQVVIPPSVGIKGAYTWVYSPMETPIAELTAPWLNFLLSFTDDPTEPTNVIRLTKAKFELPEIIGIGKRNDTLFKYGCSLLSQNMDTDQVMQKLEQANQERCYQPLSSSELNTCFKSALKTYQRGQMDKVNKLSNVMVTDPKQVPKWLMTADKGFAIDEVKFVDEFINKYGLVYINYTFYNQNGVVKEGAIGQLISNEIKKYFKTGLATKTNKLVDLLKLQAYTKPPEVLKDVVNFKNGTFKATNNGLVRIKPLFTLNKIDYDYNPDAACPRWLTFLNELLDEKEIDILQEYLGYLMIPSTLGQKAMFLLGEGNEGKSRVGIIITRILGISSSVGSFHEFQTNRFLTSALENSLLFYDDDLQLQAIKDTALFKTLVTLETPLMVERKGKDHYHIQPYARFFCVGNGDITSKYDHTDGFYRRLLVLRAKPYDKNRVNDPMLVDKLMDEIDGIIAWSIEGLIRLINQNYKFSHSEYMNSIITGMREQSNNILLYFQDQTYCKLAKDDSSVVIAELNCNSLDYTCTRKELYQSYCEWCEANAFTPFSRTSFLKQFCKNLNEWRVRESSNVIRDGKRARGFIGISCKFSMNNISFNFKK